MISDEAHERASWQTKALCAQTDPEIFFPDKGGTTRDAKKVCAACEVKHECLQYALDRNEDTGVWGGTSQQERRQLRLTIKKAS